MGVVLCYVVLSINDPIETIFVVELPILELFNLFVYLIGLGTYL